MEVQRGWRAWDDGDGILHVRGTVMTPRIGCTAELRPWDGNWGPTPFRGVLEVVIHEPAEPTPTIITPVDVAWDERLCADACQTVGIRDGDEEIELVVEPGGPDR